MELTKTPARKHSPELVRIQVTLPESGRKVGLDVRGPDQRFGAPAGPEVNWSGIGAVSPADAAAYAAAIALAATMAPNLSGPLGREGE